MSDTFYLRPPAIESSFSKGLRWCGRILENPDFFVWCCSPIEGEDGRTHVFYSRWPVDCGFRGWLYHSEIAHAVADDPAGPYETIDVVLSGRGAGFWDGGTVHNPSIHRIGDTFALFYMATAYAPEAQWENALAAKRIGLATSKSLWGPWVRPSAPLIEPGKPGEWDGMLVSNPALVHGVDGPFYLYYKGMDFASWHRCSGTRKYGLAVSENLEGPYRKDPQSPMIDLSRYNRKGENLECEDAFVWFQDQRFLMLTRDMGLFDARGGLLMQSEDGILWSDPQIGYRPSPHYVEEPPNELPRRERLERPQLLFRDGRSTHLFVAIQGGRYGTSSAAVLSVAPTLEGS